MFAERFRSLRILQTAQQSFFALDERSLFENKNPHDLCKKIEYWIEHPKEKEEMSSKYIEAAKNNTLQKSIIEIERVYNQAIEDYWNKKNLSKIS